MERITNKEGFESLDNIKDNVLTIDTNLFIDMYKKLYAIESYEEKQPLSYRLNQDTNINELVDFIESNLPYRKVMRLKSLLQFGKSQNVGYEERREI